MALAGREDMKMLVVFLVAFSVFIYLVMPVLVGYAKSSLIPTFFLFVAGYSLFVNKFVFQRKITVGLAVGVALVFIAGDIIIPPLLVSPSGVSASLPVEATISSDIIIYKLLPDYLDPSIRYFMTYVLVPVLLLLLARHFLTKSQFQRGLF